MISKRIGGNNIEKLENLLRIDGYIYEKEHLYEINNDIDDKTDIIKVLYQKINLSEYNEFCTFYNYINEHISKEKWEDSISNCRKITEIVLKESALYYSKNIKKDDAEIDYKKPVKVREYLEKTAFFSEDEANIVHYFYKYMSNLGSHPEIALEEQAHFSRVMAVNIVLYTLKKLTSYVTK